MKKIIVITGILLIILSFANIVYAEAIPQLPADWISPYYLIGIDSSNRMFIHGFSDISGLYATEGIRPSLIATQDIMVQTNSYWLTSGQQEFSSESYINPYGPSSQYGNKALDTSYYGTIWDNILFINFNVKKQDGTLFMRHSEPIKNFNILDYILGTGTSPENPTIFDYFAGINFDYEGFLGKVGIKLEAKKEGQETYVPIQEWEYPEGDGTVNIDSHDIAYYNNASYKLTISDDDEVINNYYYIVNTTNEKQPYIDIMYPSNGVKYEYFPNINIEYFDMGDLKIYINEVLYKRISTAGKEGIEVIPGTHSLFQIGLNTIYVEDINSQTVATVQYMVMREGNDPTIIDEPEFDSDTWVKELYQRIMSEYSQFFIYLKNIYSFLPYEILGLVVIVIMLSVVLWFTGRK